MRRPAKENSLSDDERNALVEQWCDYAFQLAIQWHNRSQKRFELDGLTSAAQLGLMDAARTWNPERGGFHTIAWMRIKHALRYETYAQRRKGFTGLKNEEEPLAVSIENTDYKHGIPLHEALTAVDPDKSLEKADLWNAMIERIERPRQRQIIEMIYRDQAEFDEIAQLFKISRQAIQAIRNTALKRIREAIEDGAIDIGDDYEGDRRAN